MWAVLIGLILIYLTIGYFLGGRLADRYPSEQLLCLITSTTALAIILIPFISQGVLSWSITEIVKITVSCIANMLLGIMLILDLLLTLLNLVTTLAIRFFDLDIGRFMTR